jgi:cytochrome P450
VIQPLDALVQLERPSFYDDSQFAVFDRMRVEAPAFYYEPLDLYALTRMTDVRWVSTNPELFTSTQGLTLNQLRLAKDGALSAFERFNDPAGELVITQDPPRQRALRTLMSSTLTPRYLESFAEALQRFCAELIAAVPDGEPVEFVDAIASRLPIMVAAEILGVERPDLDRMKRWVWALEELTRAESMDALEEAGLCNDELKTFLRSQLQHKKVNPGRDLISNFMNSTLSGGEVPDAVVLSHVSTLMSNGGTTRLLLASIARHFATHPDDLAAVRSEPELLDTAIEECLRLTPPARGFVRTATSDVELHDTTIRAGQRVYMLYPAANRDPEVFDAPEKFDLRRSSTTHAAFRFGTHFCLGAALARMEAKELFAQLLQRFSQITPAGSAEPYRHIQLNGLATLPLVLNERGTRRQTAVGSISTIGKPAR